MSEQYIPRLVDKQLDDYLSTFGAVSVEGPKWCGKTTTASQHARSQTNMADPTGGYQARRLATLEPLLALQGDRPRLIDEWQEAPSIWDAVRYQVDSDGRRGAFILTGSATPRKGFQPSHSGAGRIGRLRMSTMTLQELGISTGSISLAGLFDGEHYAAASSMTLSDVARQVCRGGWPGVMGLDDSQAMRVARSYVDAVAETDLSAVDGTDRDSDKVRKLLQSLARNEGSLATLKTLVRDTSPTEETDEVSLSAVTDYLAALGRMYYTDDVPAWDPALKSPVRMRTAAKRHLADPSLAVAALGSDPQALLADLKYLGNLFESLALHDLKVYARNCDAQVFHYHDSTDFEVDAIVQRRNGDWMPIEIKLGIDQEDDVAASVSRLANKMVERGEREPAALVVIVGVGAVGHMRSDGVQIVPLDVLGA